MKKWQHELTQIKLTPSSGGRFEVLLNGQVVFSKHAVGRHANPGEVEELLSQRLGSV